MIQAQTSYSIIDHLMDLRSSLLRSIAFVAVLFIALLYFSNDIYRLAADPLIRHLPEGGRMIATDVATPFFTPLKFTGIVALFLSIPYILYQIWRFVAPALYKKERRLLLPLITSSTGLFYVGLAFAYFVVFPMIFSFFVSTAPNDVAIHTDISSYLDFVLTFFVVFGFAFEVPVAIVLLCTTGATTPQSLAEKRPYIIAITFFAAMFLTPPDVFSQVLLAVPVCFLFEAGLLASKFLQKEKSQRSGF